MSNEKLEFTFDLAADAPYWKDDPDGPGSQWRESDFCRGAEIFNGEIIFQYRNDSHVKTEMKDYVLCANGRLERIDVISSEKELRIRIYNIERQNGIPDISNKVLEAFVRNEIELALKKR